jgi:predicted ATPase
VDRRESRLPGRAHGTPAQPLAAGELSAEFEHDWQGHEGFSEILLEPLTPPVARELLGTMLGEDRSLALAHDLLIERSNGNPFFLEEIVRTLMETKAIVGEPGALRLVAKVDTLHVPPTVQAVVAARIDRLPREEKLLLQQASVIGIDVPLALLEAVTETPGEVGRRALRSLQAAGFIHQTSLSPTRAASVTTSRAKSPTRPCSRSSAACCTRARWSPSRGCTAIGWLRTSTTWRFTPCAANCGTRPLPTTASSACGRKSAPPTPKR